MQSSKKGAARNTGLSAFFGDDVTRAKRAGSVIHAAVVAGILMSVAPFSSASAGPAGDVAASQVDAQAKEAWRESIRHSAPQEKGCFHASYPSFQWSKVQCGEVSSFRSARGLIPNSREQVVGNGDDYAVQAPSGKLFSEVVGSFPTVTGVKSEKTVNVPFGDQESAGATGSNQYTFQLNTNMNYNAAACNGYQTGDNTGCYSWQQYILISNDFNAAGTAQTNTTDVFIQTWLENYGNDPDQNGGGGTSGNLPYVSYCPSGFIDAGPDQVGPGDDCMQNSPSTVISKKVLPITDLASLKLTGTANTGHTDTATVTYDGEAYSSSVSDKVSDIASGWNQAEFNVVGNGGGSRADFNSGSSLTVKLAVDDGSTTAPTCASNAGTTGETNNLTLGKCSAAGGSSPSIEFKESN
jgi:hypothetical protein